MPKTKHLQILVTFIFWDLTMSVDLPCLLSWFLPQWTYHVSVGNLPQTSGPLMGFSQSSQPLHLQVSHNSIIHYTETCNRFICAKQAILFIWKIISQDKAVQQERGLKACNTEYFKSVLLSQTITYRMLFKRCTKNTSKQHEFRVK